MFMQTRAGLFLEIPCEFLIIVHAIIINMSISFRLPIFTEYLIKFNCTNCPARHKFDQWNNKTFDLVPILLLPNSANSRTVGVGQLLSSMLSTPQNVDCPQCGTTNAANWETKKGRISVIVLLGPYFFSCINRVCIHQGNCKQELTNEIEWRLIWYLCFTYQSQIVSEDA